MQTMHEDSSEFLAALGAGNPEADRFLAAIAKIQACVFNCTARARIFSAMGKVAEARNCYDLRRTFFHRKDAAIVHAHQQGWLECRYVAGRKFLYSSLCGRWHFTSDLGPRDLTLPAPPPGYKEFCQPPNSQPLIREAYEILAGVPARYEGSDYAPIILGQGGHNVFKHTATQSVED